MTPIDLRRLSVFALATASLLLAGCAPTLVGKWKGNMAGQNAMNMKADGTMEFKQDGTFTQTVTAPMFGTVIATGTYTTTGENVELKVGDLQAGGKSVMGMLPAQAKDRMNQKATWKIHDDKLDLTISGKTATLDKVKE